MLRTKYCCLYSRHLEKGLDSSRIIMTVTVATGVTLAVSAAAGTAVAVIPFAVADDESLLFLPG